MLVYFTDGVLVKNPLKNFPRNTGIVFQPRKSEHEKTFIKMLIRAPRAKMLTPSIINASSFQWARTGVIKTFCSLFPLSSRTKQKQANKSEFWRGGGDVFFVLDQLR